MKKRLLISCLMLQAVLVAAPLCASATDPCAPECRGICEDDARISALRARVAKNAASHFGLSLLQAPENRDLYILENKQAWRVLTNQRGDAEELNHARKKLGYAQMDGNFYAVRPPVAPTDVPVPSPFFGMLRQNLPAHLGFNLVGAYDETDLLAWGAGQYQRNFSTSQKDKNFPELYVSNLAEDKFSSVISRVRAIMNYRDLIATSLNQFMPIDGAHLTQDLANKFGASLETFVEHDLHTHFRMAWEVGKGSARRPNVTILTWEPQDQEPVLTLDLVGKGVCFDTGGHNLKTPSESAATMFADKGGALAQLMLATLIMEANLPVKVRVANGWVVNVPGPGAQMQSDIYKTLAGQVENADTDAEGRLVLASILNYLRQNNPAQVTITAATLTWAQLVATGKNAGLFHARKSDPFTKHLKRGMHTAKDPMVHHGIDARFLDELRKASKRADMVTCTTLEGDSARADAFLRVHASQTTQFAHADIACADTGTPGMTPGVENLDMFYVLGAFEAVKTYVTAHQEQVASSS
ncbi:MAG: leucyl aminopeptidase family protein [Proteobacteria bacterium]|nr:leucyl aminopeptidase family protein [Pseudomonadota bacterium]